MSAETATATCETIESLHLLHRELRKLERGFAEADQRLENLRRTVVEELGRATSPREVAGLADLLEAIEWCLGATNQDKIAAAEAVSEKGREAEELLPKSTISRDRHWWEGGWQMASGASAENVQEKLEEAVRRVNALSAQLPGGEQIQAAAQDNLSYSELLSELDAHVCTWDEIHLQAIDDLAAQAYARPGGPKRSRTRHVLIVEDDDNWRGDVEREVRRQLRDLELHEIQVVSVPHCQAARAKVQELGANGVLAICDLGLPENQQYYERQVSDERPVFDARNGLKLLAEFRDAGARVVALTSQDQMAGAFINLTFRFDDFLLKGISGWEQDLADRLRAWLLPIDPQTLPLLVPTFDTRIRLGPVWVDLPPLAFEIVHALASAAIDLRPVTPAAFSQPTGKPSVSQPLETVSLQRLQEDMCRADLTGLPEDFMDSDTFRKNVAAHLRAIDAAIQEAFESVDLRILEKHLVVQERQRKRQPEFRLRCAEVEIVDSPIVYRERTERNKPPYAILVIEDDPAIAVQIVSQLRRTLPRGSTVESAATYEEAIDKAVELQPVVATLDLNLPKEGVARGEVGVELRQWLQKNIHGIGIVVLTAETDQRLQRLLSRPVDGNFPWSRLRNIDRLSKSDSQWLPKLQLRVLRLLKEREGLLPTLPVATHRVHVDARDLQELAVDGAKIAIPRTPNAERDLAIITLLASYDNQPLRRQAILDYWHEHGLADGVNNPGQRLTERIEFLRQKISEGAGVPGDEIIAGDGQSYRLQGFVELTGL